MTFKGLREQSGMNKKRFAEYFGIPYRTVQNWEAGVNKCPDYLLNLLEYKLNVETMFARYKKGVYIGKFDPLKNSKNEPIIDEETAAKVQEAIKRRLDEKGG